MSDPSTNPLIELNSVSRHISEAGGKRTILDQITFTAGKGNFISITGPSGAGKSTLLNLISGIDIPDSGQVVCCGKNLHEMSDTQRTQFRKSCIGYVFQFFNLIPTLTVLENLQLPLSLNNATEDENATMQWLERFDLADRHDAYPDVLSGGEQQRIAVIRAAIHKPEIIVADEPTGNLDQGNGRKVLSALQEIALNGTCIVMATHNQEAAEFASSNYRLEDGRLKTVDT